MLIEGKMKKENGFWILEVKELQVTISHHSILYCVKAIKNICKVDFTEYDQLKLYFDDDGKFYIKG